MSISKQALLLIGLSLASAAAPPATSATAASHLARWQAQARAVTLTRDDWGIAHIRGKHRCRSRVRHDLRAGRRRLQSRRDQLPRRRSAVLPKPRARRAVYQDLRQKLFVDPEDLPSAYGASPPGCKLLMNAWADGLNYLSHHPPGRHAARHQPLRAVDGAELHRGQHRRRHRAHLAQRARRHSTASTRRRRRRRGDRGAAASRAGRLERHRHRARQHRATTTRCC